MEMMEMILEIDKNLNQIIPCDNKKFLTNFSYTTPLCEAIYCEDKKMVEYL